MSFNLLDTVRGLFSNELISKAAASLGETEGGIQKVLSGAVPSVLAGLLGKASGSEGAAGILNMAKEAAGSGILGNLGGFLEGNNSDLLQKGGAMLKGLLGDKISAITNLLSSHAAVKQSSVASILSMTAPAALGSLGKHATENNLNTGGLMSFLSGQKASIMSALPPGLGSITSMLGLGTAAAAANSFSDKVSEPVHHNDRTEAENPGTGYKMLTTILMGILLVAAAIYFFKGCGQNETIVTPASDTIVIKKDTIATTPVMAGGPESIKVKLPNGTELDAYKGGIEDKLVAFLSADYAKLGADSLKKIWFDFDNLNFKTGSADLTPESQRQVDNISAVLKAFPAAKIKIGGYTDKTGNEESNKKLSEERAKAVRIALDKVGVAKQVIDAEGYGSAQAKYPADAPESDRVKDRRVSVSVRL